MAPALGKSKKISSNERWLSLAVFVLLALVAAGILYKQQFPSPALQRPAALSGSAQVTAKAEKADGLDLATLAGKALQPLSQPEHFTPDTLYHKINGKADLYLQAGFKSLSALRLALPAEEQAWCEALLYRHESAAGAFAVYGQQRRPKAQPLSFYSLGYLSQNALYLTRGPYYLEIVAASLNEKLNQAMEQLARNFIAAVPQGESQAELGWFPSDGLIPGSQTLLANDAFGFAGLSGVYAARYQNGVLFVSRRKSPQEAEALMQSYVAFLKENDGQPEAAPTEPSGAELLEVIGLYELVFTHGPLFCGVHEADSPESAVAMGKALAARIKESQP